MGNWPAEPPSGRMVLPKYALPQLAAAGCIIFPLMQGASPGAAENTMSVWEGVYTKEQAARGKTRYFTSCAVCHGPQLQGDSDSPELAGKSFMKRWGDQSVATLFAFASSQMPIGRPGSLGVQGYADVIAHILATNGFPEGQRELPANGQALERIIIEQKK
jgi:S-disulfanyl-L-cysteine oxidoreductase SoxD